MTFRTTQLTVNFIDHRATAVLQSSDGVSITVLMAPVRHTVGESEDDLRAAARDAVLAALKDAVVNWTDE